MTDGTYENTAIAGEKSCSPCLNGKACCDSTTGGDSVMVNPNHNCPTCAENCRGCSSSTQCTQGCKMFSNIQYFQDFNGQCVTTCPL